MTKFQWQKVENKLERTVAFYKYVDIVKNFIKNLMWVLFVKLLLPKRV